MEYRSFEQIYLQYYKPVYAYLMTLCPKRGTGSRTDPGDLLQGAGCH